MINYDPRKPWNPPLPKADLEKLLAEEKRLLSQVEIVQAEIKKAKAVSIDMAMAEYKKAKQRWWQAQVNRRKQYINEIVLPPKDTKYSIRVSDEDFCSVHSAWEYIIAVYKNSVFDFDRITKVDYTMFQYALDTDVTAINPWEPQ